MRTDGERVLPNEGLGGGSRVGNRKEKGEVFWRGSGGAVSDRASAEDCASAPPWDRRSLGALAGL